MDEIAFLGGGTPRTRLPSAIRPVRMTLGLAAAASLCGAAVAILLDDPSAALLSFVGHAALFVYAMASVRRPYARFWLPSISLLALVGAAGAVIAALPASDETLSLATATHLGLSALRCGAQLGAMALTAIAWSTAGRSRVHAQNSLFALSVTATSQLLAAIALVSAVPVTAVFDGLAELCFALWLLVTVSRTWSARRARKHIACIPKSERLPAEPWVSMQLATQHGDVLL